VTTADFLVRPQSGQRLPDPDGLTIEPGEAEADPIEVLIPDELVDEGADDGGRPLMACRTRLHGESGAGRMVSASGVSSGDWTVDCD